MSLKIFLTSDIHLGMKFAGYPEVQSELSEARFNNLNKLVNLANENKCALFVIAGDLFDRVSITKKDIIKASNILKNFQGKLSVILPGNHDYISVGQTDLWSYFRDNQPDNVLILEERKIYSLEHFDLKVRLYACPCYSKHSNENAVEWINDLEKDSEDTCHIGIAHGSLEGFSPDFDKKYYPMTVSELQKYGLNLWLIGHTHAQYPVKPGSSDRIFYAGTPEPDGFDCQHNGKAWIIEVDDKRKINHHSLETGIYKFLHDEIEVNNSHDIELLKKRYSSDQYKNTLLKLKITGKLPKDEYKNLPEIIKNLESQLFYISLNTDELTEEITLDIINQEFSEGSFPHRLLSELSHESELLQLAYDLIREVRK